MAEHRIVLELDLGVGAIVAVVMVLIGLTGWMVAHYSRRR